MMVLAEPIVFIPVNSFIIISVIQPPKVLPEIKYSEGKERETTGSKDLGANIVNLLIKSMQLEKCTIEHEEVAELNISLCL